MGGGAVTLLTDCPCCVGCPCTLYIDTKCYDYGVTPAAECTPCCPDNYTIPESCEGHFSVDPCDLPAKITYIPISDTCDSQQPNQYFTVNVPTDVWCGGDLYEIFSLTLEWTCGGGYHEKTEYYQSSVTICWPTTDEGCDGTCIINLIVRYSKVVTGSPDCRVYISPYGSWQTLPVVCDVGINWTMYPPDPHGFIVPRDIYGRSNYLDPNPCMPGLPSTFCYPNRANGGPQKVTVFVKAPCILVHGDTPPRGWARWVHAGFYVRDAHPSSVCSLRPRTEGMSVDVWLYDPSVPSGPGSSCCDPSQALAVSSTPGGFIRSWECGVDACP